MKQILTRTFAVLAIAAVTAPAMNAAAVTYADGDLFMGFRATANPGSNQTYLINLGQASTFRDATPGNSINLQLGNIAVDLASIYGANWASRADIFWGVAGVTSAATAADPAHTLYASRNSPLGNSLATAWARRSNSNQTVTESKIQTAALGYLNDPEGSTANSPRGEIQESGAPNDWAEFQPSGSQTTDTQSFATWNPTIEGSSPNGIANSELDLFRMTPNSTANTLGDYEGTFTIGNNGAVVYSVVPEPGSVGLIGLGAGLLGILRRRTPRSL